MLQLKHVIQVKILAKKNKKENLGPIPLLLFRAYPFLDDMLVSIHGSVHCIINWMPFHMSNMQIAFILGWPFEHQCIDT